MKKVSRTVTRRGWRMAHRRAYWILLGTALAAVCIWRNVPRTPAALHPSIPVPSLPPLAAKPVRMHYHELPLATALADLSTQAGVRFEINWDALAAAHLTRETLVSGQTDGAKTIPLSAAIVALVPPYNPLDADFSSEPVEISSRDELRSAAHAVTVTYSVKDLLEVESPFHTFRTAQERSAALASWVRDSVEPEDWIDKGGSAGRIEVDSNTLIVEATPTMQYQIRELLTSLRGR